MSNLASESDYSASWPKQNADAADRCMSSQTFFILVQQCNQHTTLDIKAYSSQVLKEVTVSSQCHCNLYHHIRFLGLTKHTLERLNIVLYLTYLL